MAEKIRKTQTVNPAGGMNQDDSIISPAMDAAGHSLFQMGDYRYALNGRIGSSRSDNFGDFEVIKSTLPVLDYWAKNNVVANPSFVGSLSPWLSLAVGGPSSDWDYLSGEAQLSIDFSGAFSSYIRYQSIAPGFTEVTVRHSASLVSSSIVTLYFNLVWLNGTTVIGTENLITGAFTNNSGSIILQIPDDVDGIGFQVTGSTTAIDLIFNLNYFQVTGWALSSKPTGTEKVIGKYEDYEFQRLYYAVYNSNDDHCIRYWDPATNAVYELLKWDGLKFLSTYFVDMAKLDNWLAVTDRNNRPRLIDVDTINDLFLTLDSTSDFREFHISFHKWAPTMPPVLRSYYDGSTNNVEKLKNKVYPVSYRYIYNGNLKSRWSPISNWGDPTDATSGGSTVGQITAIEVYLPGFFLNDPDATTQWNYFGHNDIKFTEAVKYIEVAYRDSALDIWRLWKRYDAPTFASTYSNKIYFTGDADSTPIPVDDFEQLFDTVPFKAGTVEAIDNRFVFGDCLNEHAAADPVSVTNVSVVQHKTTGVGYWAGNVGSSFTSLSTSQKDDIARRNDLTQRGFKMRGVYKLVLQYLDRNGWRTAGYGSDLLTFPITETSDFATSMTEPDNALAFKFATTFKPPVEAVAYQWLRTNCLNIDSFMFGVANRFVGLVDNVTSITDRLALPQSTKDRINQHFENSRLVQASDLSTEIKNESKSGPSGGLGVAGAEQQADLIKQKNLGHYLTINSIVFKLAPEVRNTINAVIPISNCSRIFIDVNNWYNSSSQSVETNNNPLNKLFYNFRRGDRVRFTGSEVSSPSSTSQLKIFDVPILEFTGTGIIIERPETLLWIPPDNEAGVAGFKHTVEVYTPNIPGESDYIYYEMGEWYPVLYPGSDQRDWSKSDWTWTVNSAVTGVTYGSGISSLNVFSKVPVFSGDVHSFVKTFYSDHVAGRLDAVSFTTASMSPIKDQTYNFWEKCNGRPGIAYTTLPQEKFIPTQARFGGKIIEQSLVNALNRFRDEDQNVYPTEYGRIRKLVNTSNAQVESVGSILLAIGEREAWSIYVNRTTLEDLSGRTQVSISDKILGSYNTLLGSLGTLNPESVSKNRGKVWWWSGIQGVWARYGRDGLTPISDYKMRNWFREISTLLISLYQTDEAPRVISDYDVFNEELVTFINHSTLPASFRGYSTYKGNMFSENDTRWKSVHSYEPEMFGKLNAQLVSFVNGDVLLHEKGTDYLNFYGVKKDAQYEPVFNQEPNSAKSWQDLSVSATDKWSIEQFQSEYRGATKTVQQSRIKLESFEIKEDAFFASIPNDLNTPNISNPIIEGDKMRSRALRTLLKLDPSIETLSLLHYVTVGYIDSPKNP